MGKSRIITGDGRTSQLLIEFILRSSNIFLRFVVVVVVFCIFAPVPRLMYTDSVFPIPVIAHGAP